DNYLKLNNWLRVWDTRNRLIKLYIKTEKWKQAKSLAQENLKTLARLEGSDSYAYRYAHTHLNLSMACFHTGNAALAERHIKMAEGVKIDSDWSFDYKNNLFLTFTEAYKTIKNFEKAYDFSIRYINVKDSFRNESNQKKIAELEKKFESEKKEQEIKALQQTTAIQTLELEKKNAQLKNQLIIASLVLVLVVGGAYLFYRQYKLKRDKVGLELQERFLRSQLNPHFIFNSLIAIQNYLTNRPKEDAGEYLGMFSTLMRQILENSREEFIPLEEEINMLKHYLELQKIRFHEAFDYHIEVDENLDEEDTMVPPMFAQPFIENALEHGLFKKDGKNEIFVRFGAKSSEIVNLEITDSGIGIIGNEVKASGHKSLAKTITNERLEKMKVSYKADVKLITRNLTSDDGEVLGHRVSLDLPSKRVAS
ncbi:MAG: histidine kinase, partial [Bacteroidota bacterium]